MSSYRYSIAKDVLNENDKNRLLCLFLSCNPSAIDWKRATQEYGSASVESMRVCTRAVYKKLDDAGVRMDGSNTGAPRLKAGLKASPSKKGKSTATAKAAAAVGVGNDEDVDDEEVAMPTSPKNTAGIKREAEEDNGDVDDEEVATPKPKRKRGRPAKKTNNPAKNVDSPIEDPFLAFTHIGDNNDDEAEHPVKMEPF